MFNDTYKSIVKELTRKSRRELQRLSVSILKKGLYSKLTKTEKELLNKIDNFIGRSYFEGGFEWTTKEILELCTELLTCKKCQMSAQQFVKDATKQSASEKAQIEHMKLRGFEISKMPAIREKIEARLDELESLMKARNYAEAEELLASITQFASVLTEEQRDFLGAASLAIAENLDWSA